MGRKHKHPEHVNHERWLVSYADFVTLLFAFFVVMFAVSQVDTKKMGRFTESFAGAVQWQMFDDRGAGMMPDRAQNSPVSSDEGSAKKAAPPDPTTKEAKEEKARDLAKKMERKLKANPELMSLRVLDAHGEIVLRLPERLLFDTGAAEIHPEGREALVIIANELAGQDVSIRVEGHTDSAPIHTSQFPSNWELSGARAMHVLRVLSETKKLSPRELSASGYGEYHPIAKNDNADGRAQNRRVDLVIVVSPDRQ